MCRIYNRVKDSEGRPSQAAGSEMTETNSFLEAVPSLWRQLRGRTPWVHPLGELLVCGALSCGGGLSSAAQVSLLLAVNTGGPVWVSQETFANHIAGLDLSSLAVGLRFLPRPTHPGDESGWLACAFTEKSAPNVFPILRKLVEVSYA